MQHPSTHRMAPIIMALTLMAMPFTQATANDTADDGQMLDLSSLPSPSFPTATLVTPIAASKASPGCSVGDIYASGSSLIKSLNTPSDTKVDTPSVEDNPT